MVQAFEQSYAEQIAQNKKPASDIPIYDYMCTYFKKIEKNIQKSTAESYRGMINGRIRRYFTARKDLTVGNQYLHISTRKMKYLMDNNYIPHENTGHTTHKYRVRTEDAVRFKARMDTEPGFLSELSGMFSNRAEWHPLPMFEATPENCEAFRRWLDSQWAELPEALPTQTAAELVGHSPQRIHEWIREEVLVGIKLGTIQYCAKAEFIGFMASPQRLAHPRTEKYKELIREFKYVQRRERENEQRRQKRKMMKEST